MRALAVFFATYFLSMVTLVFSWHALDFERSHVSMIALYLLILGALFGAMAGWWSWTHRHPRVFLGATFAAGMTILLPIVVVTYGFALVASPLVVLWTGTALLGLKLTRRMRAKHQG